MASDPVAEALRVAHREASSFYSLPETAAIIAAFLRALPAPYWQDNQPAFGDLAAAVERAASAAREAGNG